MCQFDEKFHPHCHHHTHISLHRAHIGAPAARCMQYHAGVGRCQIRFTYNIWWQYPSQRAPGPDYFQGQRSHLEDNGTGRCYFPSCGLSWDMQSLDRSFDWSDTVFATEREFRRQPRFQTPRNGETEQQRDEWMYKEIIYAQRLAFLARHYAVHAQAVQLNSWNLLQQREERDGLPPGSQERAAVQREFDALNTLTGAINTELLRLQDWIEQVWSQRNQDLANSPYFCRPSMMNVNGAPILVSGWCAGAMQLDLRCACNMMQYNAHGALGVPLTF